MSVLTCPPILKPLAAGLGLAAILSLPAHADLAVTFDEGAPKDRFTFKNVGTCAIKASELVLDLSGSKSGLIFDVTASGAGVEVFQPLELVKGKAAVASVPNVADGDNQIAFDIVSLEPGAEIAFTIDVDDTMGGREITVAGSEIQGAVVRHISASKTSTTTISADATARMALASC